MRLSARSSRKWYTGKRKSVKLMSSTSWESCILCSPPPSIGPQKDAPQQEVLSLLLNSIGKVWVPSPIDILLAVSNLVHPKTSFGAKIWTLSKIELNMLKQVHRNNILRTIQGLPMRCHSSSLNYMLGSSNNESMIFQCKLNFINSIISLDNNSLPKKLLINRIRDPLAKGLIPDLQTMLDHLNLPSINFS